MQHPDANADSEADLVAAGLNEARGVLVDAEKRANALLALLGGPGKEQDKGLPAGFLARVMELREAVEADLAADAAAARERWSRHAREQRDAHAAAVGAMFAALSKPPAAAELVAIRRELNAWRYSERLIEQLSPEYDPKTAGL